MTDDSKRLGSPRFLAVQTAFGLSFFWLGLLSITVGTVTSLFEGGLALREVGGVVAALTVGGAALTICTHAVVTLASYATVSEESISFRNVAVSHTLPLGPATNVGVARRSGSLGFVVRLSTSDGEQHDVLATGSIIGGRRRVAAEADVIQSAANHATPRPAP